MQDVFTPLAVDIYFMENISVKFDLNPLNFVRLAPFSGECALKDLEFLTC